jgi:LAO/AO transport system kinase
LKILLHSPDAGDDIQMLKAGLLETADLHVVNKYDRPGAAAWAAELEAILGAGAESPPCVLRVSAATGEGIDAVVEKLVQRRQARQGGT